MHDQDQEIQPGMRMRRRAGRSRWGCGCCLDTNRLLLDLRSGTRFGKAFSVQVHDKENQRTPNRIARCLFKPAPVGKYQRSR